MSLHIPEEVIYIMMSFICILNMKDYVNYYGGDFFTLCRKLKDSKGLIAGKFPLFCMIGKYSMLNDEYHERAPNRSLMVPIEIFLNTTHVSSLEFWIIYKGLSYTNIKPIEYQCMDEINTAFRGILRNPVNTKISYYYVMQIHNDILDDTETCSILKRLTSKYRGHIRNVDDFIQLTFESSILKITFDGETIHVTDWFSTIFREIRSDQLILYLPSSKDWKPYPNSTDSYFTRDAKYEEASIVYESRMSDTRSTIDSLFTVDISEDGKRHDSYNTVSEEIIDNAKEKMCKNLVGYLTDGFEII